jgi:glycosyltransferase involved in cell wall biosynthesis
MRAVARHHRLHLVTFTQVAHQPDQAAVSAAIAELTRFCSASAAMPLPQDRRWLGQLGLAAQSLLPGPPFTVRWGTCRSYAAAVRSAVNDFRPDIVHFDTVSLAPYLSEIGDTPAVLNHHNIESHMLRRRAYGESNAARKAYYLQEAIRLNRYERSVAPRFRTHLVCSTLDAERLTECVGPVNVRVVPNGADLDYFQPAATDTNPEPFSMVFVGGLGWYPNLAAMRHFLAEVWPLVRQELPGARIRIIGRSPPEDLIAMCQQDKFVELLGFVDDIRPIVHRSAVYVCPIRDGGGTKLKMLDAMAMGKAIVAHPVATEGLSLVDGDQCLIAAEPRDFADKILSVLRSDNQRQALEQRARRHVEEHFDFERIGASLADMYQTIAAQL